MQILRWRKSVYALDFVDEIAEYDYEISEAPGDRDTYLRTILHRDKLRTRDS